MKRTERRPRYSIAFTGATAQAVPESGHPSESPLYGRLRRGIKIFPSDIYLGLKQRLQTGGMEPIVVTALSGFPGGGTSWLRDDGTFTTVTVTPTSITPMTSDRLLGRDTAGPGAAEQLTVTGGVEFTTAGGIQTSAFTGDVTKAAGGVAQTIPNNTIDNPRLADMAQDTIKGRTSGAGTGDPVDLTATQATAILNNMVGDSGAGGTKGLAPAPAAGDTAAGKFLKANGVWTAPTVQQSALLDGGTVHTDTTNSAVTRGDIIIGNSTPAWDDLAIGTLLNPKRVLSSDGTDPSWVQNQGAAAHVPTEGDTAINSITDVTIVTKDITSVAAGDQIVVEGEFVILNNSTATRVYNICVDFDGAMVVEWVTAALATSATLLHPMSFRAVCNIRATNLAYSVNRAWMGPAAGIAAGGDPTMAATDLTAISWGNTTNDLTPTTTVTLKIRSASATATQTCRCVHFVIKKYTPF